MFLTYLIMFIVGLFIGGIIGFVYKWRNEIKVEKITSTNTASPKLPTFESFRNYWMSSKHQNVRDLYEWFVGNIRA